jgi:hypothetical protein
MKNFGALSSSVNPTQLSATVSGTILSVSAIIIFFAGQLGFNLGTADITSFASQAGVSVGFLWFLFGLIRKVVVSIQQKWATYHSS